MSAVTQIGSAEIAPQIVVGVGASAGGLEAIERFFENVPPDTRASYVVIQHLSPGHKSMMGEILARHTSLPIHQVENEMFIEKGHLYLIPPKKNMIVSGGRLLLSDQESTSSLNLPIDIFFRSLAAEYQAAAVGVVLSGSGSDGTKGLKAIKDAGGFTFIQKPSDAKFNSMPSSAAKASRVDFITSPEEMSEVIESLVITNRDSQIATGGLLQEIFNALEHKYSIDFSKYKPATIDRRIARRIGLSKKTDLPSYFELLKSDPQELEALYQDLLIVVTSFFRDPEAFAELQTHCFEALFVNAAKTGKLRVWVPACATGEEGYSLAIALLNHAEKIGANDISIKVFCTDVHTESLEKASAGFYTDEQISTLPEADIEKWFFEGDSGYQVTSELRSKVVFASQNVVSDPPFTQMDLISCRNLLIYLNNDTQKKILSLFHFSLRTGGFMLLGPSENLGALSSEFDVLSQKWNLFSKRRDSRILEMIPSGFSSSQFLQSSAAVIGKSQNAVSDPIVHWGYQALLSDMVSSGFLFDEDRHLLHIFGEGSKYVNLGSGKLTTNVIKLVDPKIGSFITASLHQLEKRPNQLINANLTMDDGEKIEASVRQLPKKYGKRKYYFCLLAESSSLEPREEVSFFTENEQRYQDLESELSEARASLQSTNEALETSNEELQATNEELLAANEELQSTNEELQSTNEELQSTNEELQSLNQELYTVNEEYQEKITELDSLAADYDNALRASDACLVYLDSSLIIRSYSPKAVGLLGVRQDDIGEGVSVLEDALQVIPDDLKRDCQEVLESVISIQKSIKLSEGQSMIQLRISPYRKVTGEVDGLVLTFSDDTPFFEMRSELEVTKDELAESRQTLQKVVYSMTHDFQAPVRQIDWCLQRLNEATEVETKDLLEGLQARISQLKENSERLSVYTMVYSKPCEFEVISLNAPLEFAIKELSKSIAERNIDVRISDLPDARCDAFQTQLVFKELIANAIKYQDDENPFVEISAQRLGDLVQVSISDNGLGVADEDIDSLFDLFSIGVSEGVSHGAGVGLAMVKRIVERMEGSVRYRPREDKGSRFIFTLPGVP